MPRGLCSRCLRIPSPCDRRRRRPSPAAQPRQATTCALEAPAARLRAAVEGARSNKQCLVIPACYDALSAKIIAESGGFSAAFMSGYGVSASRLGEPDAGLVSYSEMEDAGRQCCRAAGGLPLIGDGDTGFGAIQNIYKAVEGYASAGFAAISIEDQTFPKRCSFSKGMRCVSREEAIQRVKVALAAAKECQEKTGREIIVVGRTDVRNDTSVDDPFREALWRAQAFEDLGCEIVYYEGPQSTEEMRTFNQSIAGAATMLAQVEKPGRLLLTASECAELGYTLCLHGLTLLSASVQSCRQALQQLQEGTPPLPAAQGGILCDFDSLYSLVGFDRLENLETQFDSQARES